jgi:pheromone shutdown protein TraB
MGSWTGDSADETGDDIQARSILCSDAVVARMSSGFARFIHPGNPALSHTGIAERDKYIATDSLSIAAKRVTEGCPGWACMR